MATAGPVREDLPAHSKEAPPVPWFCAPIQAADAQGLLRQLPDWKRVDPHLKLNESNALAVLGRGSYGKVYAALDTKHHCTKAVKVVTLTDPCNLVSSVAEVLAQLQLPAHPNLLKGELLHSPPSGRSPGALQVIMPQCFGTVETYLHHHMACSAPTRKPHAIPQQTCIAFSSDLLSAVRHLHFHGVVHGDLSPNNLLVFVSGTRAVLRVGDLGASRVVQGWKGESPPRTPIPGLPGGFCTFSYCAPENLLRTEGGQVGFPIDDWSVGAMISEWYLGWWWTRPHGYSFWSREHWVECHGAIVQGATYELQCRAPELEQAVVGALCKLLEVNPLQRASVNDVVSTLGAGASPAPACSTPLLLRSPGPLLTARKSPAERGQNAGVCFGRAGSTSPSCPAGAAVPHHQAWVRLQEAKVSEDFCKCKGHCSTNCPARGKRLICKQPIRQSCPNRQAPGRIFCESCRCQEPGCNKSRSEGSTLCRRCDSQVVSAASSGRGIPTAPLSSRAGTSAGSSTQELEQPAPHPTSSPHRLPTVAEMAALFKRETISCATPDFFPDESRLLILRSHVAARVVLSSPGEALLRFPPPRGSVGTCWLLGARSCRLALGQATLESVTLLKAPQWYHWEAQAHSEDPKHAGGVTDFYVWKFVNAEPWQYPRICPKLGAFKYLTAPQWAAQQATPEDTQDSPELKKARDAAAQEVSSLLSPWAGPGPGVRLPPTPGQTPAPDKPSSKRQHHPRKKKDEKEEQQGAGTGQEGNAAKHKGRKRKAETPDQEGTPRGDHSGKVLRQGDPGPMAEAAGQGKEGTGDSSPAHSLAAPQQPMTGAGRGSLAAPCQPPQAVAEAAGQGKEGTSASSSAHLAAAQQLETGGGEGDPPAPCCPPPDGARPSGASLGPAGWLPPAATLSQHACQVFELLHALAPIKQWLQPMDLQSFVRLHPQTKDDLALQVMVAMVKHPLFAEDLVDHALKTQGGESHTDRLARATRKALELHSERLQHRDAATLQCHATLDYHISHVTGVATWCQRLKLVSKVPSSSQGAAEGLMLSPAGQQYFWTGDTTLLQGLVPRSGLAGMHWDSHGSSLVATHMSLVCKGMARPSTAAPASVPACGASPPSLPRWTPAISPTSLNLTAPTP